jgi:cystathionine gamma-synthase
MKTLALRMERHQANASALARTLSEHPLVEKVFYPGLDPEAAAVQRSQAAGFGGILSFRVTDSDLVAPFLRSLELITFAESLGGVESLITYPATQTHADLPEERRRSTGVCDRLLRLSVGIEHPEDLIDDLNQALDRAERIVKGGGTGGIRNPTASQRQ